MIVKIYSHFDKKEDEILRNISQEISKEEFNSSETKKIVDELFEFIVQQPDGAGLSAPQIGVNKRIFVINPRMFDYEKNGDIVPKNKTNEECIYINPKILSFSKEESEMEEGCFSVR
jgi:peptide deformylase